MRIVFSKNGWEEYMDWQQTDKAMVKRINRLIQDMLRSPFAGIGKPEPLKHGSSGLWSRRIDEEHRLIYRVENDALEIAACRGHYDD